MTHSPRIHITLSNENSDLLSELAEGIGCSRSAVAAYLLEDSLSELANIPLRSRAKSLKDARRCLGDNDEWLQKAVRRARGPSLAYISTALFALQELARDRWHGA